MMWDGIDVTEVGCSLLDKSRKPVHAKVAGAYAPHCACDHRSRTLVGSANRPIVLMKRTWTGSITSPFYTHRHCFLVCGLTTKAQTAKSVSRKQGCCYQMVAPLLTPYDSATKRSAFKHAIHFAV